MPATDRRARLIEQYADAKRARKWKRAEQIYLPLKNATTLALRRGMRTKRRART